MRTLSVVEQQSGQPEDAVLVFAVAASANLPTIVFTLFWKRFNIRGALWSMYGCLAWPPPWY